VESVNGVLDIAMLGVAVGQEQRLSRFLDVPHRFVLPIPQQQAVDALITLRFGAVEARQFAPRLIHLPGAGLDAIDLNSVADDCVVCNVFEHEIPIAEYGMAAILTHAVNYLPMVQTFDSDRFGEIHAARRPHGEVNGKILGLVGYGHIGREIAARARSFGMRVHAVTRSGVADGADRAYPVQQLHSMLAGADFLMIACPLTDQTRGMIGHAEFEVMKRSVVIINVSRAPVLDEEALFRALSERRIAGATLDVWYQYPSAAEPSARPSRFAFERLPNVHCTPHSSAWTEEMFDRRFATIAENLRRLQLGQPLTNVVRAARTRPPSAATPQPH
jgi:phosphoglycerate dehydrogenase-like enzyme